jgi:hypothetical protein
MDRRTVLMGGAAAAAPALPALTKPSYSNHEVAQYYRGDAVVSDDWKTWPDVHRRAAHAAQQRFLNQNPGVRVVSFNTYVSRRGVDPRYPDCADGTPMLVYQIIVDPAVQGDG